jgi:zinc D-Ala-D-Ala carboxypeptidase
MKPMMLSTNFSLEELTRTSHKGISNTPDAQASSFLVKLANDFLQPIRAKFGAQRVTSGYRSRELNEAIPGSASDSAHCYGCAADIQSVDGHTPEEMARWVAFESGLDFDQVIDEARNGGHWLHIGMLRPGHELHARHQALVIHDGVRSVLKP